MAKYLIRFDDICPTMRWPMWDRVEQVLTANGVSPILAVVPDNRDASLDAEPPCEAFWQRVREWQARGWTIGMHGYQHRYTSRSAGIVGIKKKSEFAGVPVEEQRSRLEAAAAIFARQGVRPDVWVAPGHSFDEQTLRLLPEVGITRISDGLFFWPRTDRQGLLWVPQQMWRFRRMPFGVWTVCLHMNGWGERELQRFALDVATFRSQIITFHEAARATRNRPNIFSPLLRRLILMKAARP